MQRRDRARCATTAAAALAMAAVVVVVALVVLPACVTAQSPDTRAAVDNAPVTVAATPSAAAAMLHTAAYHVPVTVYIRMRRQSQPPAGRRGGGVFAQWFGNNNDDDDDKNNNNNNDATTTASTAAELDEELPLPPTATTTSQQHRAQVVRVLPPAYTPRYAVTRSATLPATQLLSLTAHEMQQSPRRRESAYAIRFAFGEGVQRETTWLPLARRHLTSDTTSTTAVTETNNNNNNNNNNNDNNKDGDTTHVAVARVEYLHRITFAFAYSSVDGEFGGAGDGDDVRSGATRVTRLRVYTSYTRRPTSTLTLTYVWREKSAYAPHRALALCSLCAVAAAALTLVCVVRSHGSDVRRQFASGRVVVRTHSE